MLFLLHNILIGFGIPVKLVRLIKIRAGVICIKVKKDGSLFPIFCVMIGLKQGIALSEFPSSCSLEYITTSVQESKEGMELNDT
jgi:hypothetical protein